MYEIEETQYYIRITLEVVRKAPLVNISCLHKFIKNERRGLQFMLCIIL